LSTAPGPADPPRNYFVPHFGEDEDIKFTKNNIAKAESSRGTWTVKRDGNGAWVLPGVDANQYGNFRSEGAWPSDKLPVLVQTDSNLDSDPICSSAGCDQYKHKKKPRGYDINYPVPNFGVDHDIIDNHHSLEISEGALGHKLEMGTDASKAKWHNPAKDTDYNFRPKLDGDMISTAKHLGDAENTLGHKWVIDDLQIEADVNSDPICSSAGCTQYKHKKKALGYDINYPVPNLGVDHDIIDSHHSLEISEGALSHKLEMGTEKSKAKWHNPAKDTDYNFAPKLDPDMVSTAKHLGDAENSLNHKWVIDDL
jgi:hypothetical protein